MDPIEELLQPFVGYLGLGMFIDANDEIEKLPIELKTHPTVLQARLELLMAMKRWEDALLLGQSLCGLWPTTQEFFVMTAYCLHELKRTEEAKQTRLDAPSSLRETAVFNYNLACYETQLGNIDQAKRLLKSCFEKDKGFRADALDDPDLAPLWDSLSET